MSELKPVVESVINTRSVQSIIDGLLSGNMPDAPNEPIKTQQFVFGGTVPTEGLNQEQVREQAQEGLEVFDEQFRSLFHFLEQRKVNIYSVLCNQIIALFSEETREITVQSVISIGYTGSLTNGEYPFAGPCMVHGEGVFA